MDAIQFDQLLCLCLKTLQWRGFKEFQKFIGQPHAPKSNFEREELRLFLQDVLLLDAKQLMDYESETELPTATPIPVLLP